MIIKTTSKDLESICFDCGSQDSLKVISEGIALCESCFKQDKKEKNIFNRMLYSIKRKIKK